MKTIKVGNIEFDNKEYLMNGVIDVSELTKRLLYKPKYITTEAPPGDDVRFIEFRRKGKMTASMEFGTEQDGNKTQYFYFEIIDWTGMKDMDFIPLDSPRRKVAIHVRLTWDNFDDTIAKVNKALKELYKRG